MGLRMLESNRFEPNRKRCFYWFGVVKAIVQGNTIFIRTLRVKCKRWLRCCELQDPSSSADNEIYESSVTLPFIWCSHVLSPSPSLPLTTLHMWGAFVTTGVNISAYLCKIQYHLICFFGTHEVLDHLASFQSSREYWKIVICGDRVRLQGWHCPI